MNYDSLKNLVVGILKAKVNCGHRHANTEQALQWEALSMEMSNHVLTGIGSCHRNLEHAVLELTLFKLPHQKWKLSVPPSNDSVAHPAACQARERLLGISGNHISSLWIDKKCIQLIMEWEIRVCVAF